MIIYKITNTINNKIYIGLTSKDVNKRISKHIMNKTYIGKALKKYGTRFFDVSVIDVSDTFDTIKEKEKYWIKFYGCKSPNGYNLTDGGDGRVGFKITDETRQKMSKAHKGKKISLECREKLRRANLGHKHTEETKLKMGRPGSKHTEETKRKMSEAKKGRISPNKGKKTSEVTRKKLSESHKKLYEMGYVHPLTGKSPSLDTRNKIRDKLKGRKHK